MVIKSVWRIGEDWTQEEPEEVFLTKEGWILLKKGVPLKEIPEKYLADPWDDWMREKTLQEKQNGTPFSSN